MLRSDIGDKQVITTNTKAGILDPSIMRIELIPGDLINVKKIPVERETVSVSGEVFFPGGREVLGPVFRSWYPRCGKPCHQLRSRPTVDLE